MYIENPFVVSNLKFVKLKFVNLDIFVFYSCKALRNYFSKHLELRQNKVLGID